MSIANKISPLGFGGPEWLITRGLGNLSPSAPDSIPVISVSVSAGPSVDLSWADSVSDNTDYSVERADLTAAGAFAQIGLTSGAATYSDLGPFTANHRYAYRVKIVGGALANQVTNQVAVFGTGSHVGRLRRQRY